MKTSMAIAITLVVISICFSQIADIAWVDGKIVFREGYVPTNFEVTLATSGIKFDNYTDYIQCRDDKDHLDEKMDDLNPSKQKKLKPSLDYLKSENAKK